jgi:hypothetical protein
MTRNCKLLVLEMNNNSQSVFNAPKLSDVCELKHFKILSRVFSVLPYGVDLIYVLLCASICNHLSLWYYLKHLTG